jgi:Glycosyltransferase family 87
MITADFFSRADWLGRERIRGYACLAAVALIPTLWVYYQRALGPLGSDFLSFWAAGKFVLAGAPAKAYDPAAVSAVQFALGRDHWFAFISPPPMLLAVAPFSAVSYAAALPAFVITSFAGWLYVVRRMLPGAAWPAAASPVAALAAWHFQSGFLTSGLLMAGLYALPRRRFVAGLFFGALIIKPHIAMLVPLALLAGREWRAIAGAAVSSLGLLLAALLICGVQTYVSFLQIAGFWSSILRNGVGGELFPRMASFYGLLRAAGMPEHIAGAVQVLLALACAIVVWRAWRGPTEPLEKGAILITATCVAAPYLFSYDLPMLIVPLAWLWLCGERHGFRPWRKVAIFSLYLAPLAMRVLAEPLGVNLTALVSMAMLVLLLTEKGIENPSIRYP